jgi:hypothetical protein
MTGLITIEGAIAQEYPWRVLPPTKSFGSNDQDNQAHGPMGLSVNEPKTAIEANDAEKPRGECAPVHSFVMLHPALRYRHEVNPPVLE